MLIGYVSDERYLALGDVLLEFQNGPTRSRRGRGPPGPSMPTSLPVPTVSTFIVPASAPRSLT